MRASWLVVVVVVCLVAGCSADQSAQGDSAARGEVPLLGVGTELVDGFVVPEGTELMTWPTDDAFSSDVEPIWRASMWITGDPVAVFNDLAAQAAALGFGVVQQDGGNCRISQATEPKPWIDCNTDGYRIGDGLRSERVDLWVSVRSNGLPVAMVGVGTILTDRVSEFGDGPWQLRTFEPETTRAAAPAVGLAPSDVGVGDRLVEVEWHRTTLVEGSRLVAAGADSSCAGGMKAVVHVDGDPDEVFDAYADQLTSRVGPYGEPDEEVPRSDVFGRRIRMMGGAGATSQAGATMVVGRHGEPTRILIEDVCND